jgi:hypothetical protein
MDPFQALTLLPSLVDRLEKMTAELIEAKRELAALREDGYVGWDWVCQYLNVTYKTARQMLADEKILVHGKYVKKFRRSDIVRFAERHSVKLKSLDT